ncbi:hypothetical protein NOR_07102 [Metarhizium rileyi]|uniref:Uncharacterized protein n=1 Tax=Metarhizium rileyi (strain RCEF 4871) TaxID=1649241 RepID=A0A166Z061_METRR|nr:hypothetical protein NOR_07102 [Metarhizium rileyi RCEF 4871]
MYNPPETATGVSSEGNSYTKPTTYPTYGGESSRQLEQTSLSAPLAFAPAGVSTATFDEPVISRQYGTTLTETDDVDESQGPAITDEHDEQSYGNDAAGPSEEQTGWFSKEKPEYEVEVLSKRGHPVCKMVFADRRNKPKFVNAGDFKKEL